MVDTLQDPCVEIGRDLGPLLIRTVQLVIAEF